MAMRLNPRWMEARQKEISAAMPSNVFSDGNVKPYTPIVISWQKSAQWLVAKIAEAGLTPKVEQLGAGVKRISIVGSCCPTCGKEVKE